MSIVYCFVFLVKIGVGVLQKSVPVSCSMGNRSSLIIVCVCKKVEFALADVYITTTIKFSAHINACPNIAIITGLTVLF